MSTLTMKAPTLKYTIRDALDRSIYSLSERKLNNKLEEILQSHSFDDPHQSMAFMYKGTVYSSEGYRPRHKINLLSRRLYGLMDVWLQEHREMLHERLAVSNYFSCLLTKANNLGDVRALLPECMHAALFKEVFAAEHELAVLKQADIDQFNLQHARSIQTLKERIVWNMLD